MKKTPVLPRRLYELLHILAQCSGGQTDLEGYDPISLYSLQFPS